MKAALLSPALLLTALYCARGEIRLHPLFSDHLILQRDAEVPIWGTGGPGEEVTVTFAGQKKTLKVGADGRWLVKLGPLMASAEARTLTAQGTNTVKVADVLVGEVWLASGQSNMGFSLSGAHNGPAEAAKADDAQLRFFNVKNATAGAPQAEVVGEWKLSNSHNAPGFSAVAYFFARELRARLGCPVAIVQSAWGGTAGQCWLSIDALRQDPALSRHVATWEKAVVQRRELEAHPQAAADYTEKLKQWNAEVRPGFDAAMKAYNAQKAAGLEVGRKPEAPWPEPVNPDPMAVPSPSSRPGTPSVIYNAMIAPLAPFALRGAIWYQGEANGSAGIEYRALLPSLIADWRRLWGAEFPFLIVQLPGWEHDTRPAELHDWPWLREAQLMALKTPRTALAVTIDIGDPATVHPSDKLDVGRRLALAARKVAYGEKLVACGPLYRDAQREGQGMRVRFTEVGGGLTTGQPPWLPKDAQPLPLDKLTGFIIAGEDRHWVEAEAQITGDSVLVSSAQVTSPVAVRYAWANSPRANLYNKEGLPASPFRTDDWPLPSPVKAPAAKAP